MHMFLVVGKKLSMHKIVQSHAKLNFGLLFLCKRQVCTTNYDFLELDKIYLSYDYLNCIYKLWNSTPSSNIKLFDFLVVKLIYYKFS
jgi:hypothetical protein